MAQTLTLQNGLNFGIVEVAGATMSGDLTMGTNGTLTYPSGATDSGVGTPAQVLITGAVGSVVNIRCTTSITVSAGGGNKKLTLGPIKVSVGNGQTYAAATSCNALNRTVLSHTLSSNSANNVVFMAGLLQTSGKSVTGNTYSSSGGGGASPITLRVIYN